ncbi:hypothetical protein [Gracilimonas mengyeensis]|uniref:Outer membrane protein beta-barrel domain-containing protein n=1 Tax=Gracilimonas mengyeensis TaxID=1302730 RepID=A0A521EZ05_9BACT|nr:hypothetical protein [Gracilimonas mengyeensis]SMO89188.1 hypothetical protein SAMN06265219_11461 [Gracilimonas mengyeensis]
MISKTKLYTAISTLIFLMTFTAVQAQMSIGLKAGSTGIGGEFTKSITEKLNARVSGSFFSYSQDGVYADDDPSIAYDVQGDMTSIGLLVDYFPTKRWLKVSAGVYYHDFIVDGGAVPNESYTLDDKTFQPEKLGSLTGTVDYDSKIVPYAGIGLGNPLAPGSRVKVNFEIGAMYTNSPNVTMEGEGMIAPTANQDQDFENGLSDFQFYPVINLGVSFRIQ